ncbi:MAG: asparaginase [Woeseiaceae bacterium]|nr:asparaginase [Woeseiaceae bacterium]
MFIRFVTTGGTIDKIYFDDMSQFEVGDSQLKHILTEGLVNFDYDVVSMFQKDSLELTDEDRLKLKEYIEGDNADRYVISHGTDTMVETAEVLAALNGKTIVLTGALSPARFKSSDAVFNIGMAVAAVQTLEPGVYLAMNGMLFEAGKVRKNRELNCFETVVTDRS